MRTDSSPCVVRLRLRRVLRSIVAIRGGARLCHGHVQHVAIAGAARATIVDQLQLPRGRVSNVSRCVRLPGMWACAMLACTALERPSATSCDNCNKMGAANELVPSHGSQCMWRAKRCVGTTANKMRTYTNPASSSTHRSGLGSQLPQQARPHPIKALRTSKGGTVHAAIRAAAVPPPAQELTVAAALARVLGRLLRLPRKQLTTGGRLPASSGPCSRPCRRRGSARSGPGRGPPGR